MQCLECAVDEKTTEAVAVCAGCGAGVCRSHTVIGCRAELTRHARGMGVQVEERWSRAMRCAHCAQNLPSSAVAQVSAGAGCC